MSVSDWKPGSSWEHQRTDGTGIVDMVDRVVENSPRRSLVFTWARSNEAEHDLALNPQMHEGISGAWPTVLLNLKTFLETGRALPHG